MQYNVNHFGQGKKKLLIFAPILPQWNPSTDIEKTFHHYTQDYSIEHIDTLSVTMGSKSISEALLKFKDYFVQHCANADVLIGFAFGGTLLQHIADIIPRHCKLVLISAPTYADNNLVKKLESVLSLLSNNQLLEAINLVELLVQPRGQVTHTGLTNIECILNVANAKERLLHGYGLMIQTDARNTVNIGSHQSLAIIGEHSQLATLDNVLLSSKRIRVVPNAGMRVLDSNPELIHSILDQFLLGESIHE